MRVVVVVWVMLVVQEWSTGGNGGCGGDGFGGGGCWCVDTGGGGDVMVMKGCTISLRRITEIHYDTTS